MLARFGIEARRYYDRKCQRKTSLKQVELPPAKKHKASKQRKSVKQRQEEQLAASQPPRLSQLDVVELKTGLILLLQGHFDADSAKLRSDNSLAKEAAWINKLRKDQQLIEWGAAWEYMCQQVDPNPHHDLDLDPPPIAHHDLDQNDYPPDPGYLTLKEAEELLV